MLCPHGLLLLCACWSAEGQESPSAPQIPKLAWPTDPRGRIADAGKFGALRTGGKIHGGLDIGVSHIASANGRHTPLPVYAAEAGKVRYIHNNYGGKGKAVIVEHARNFTTVYGHMDPSVSVNDQVRRGQQIGTITRWPGNEHLHFGVHSGSYDPRGINRSLNGLYAANEFPDAAALERAGVLPPLKHLAPPLITDEQIDDVSKKVSEAFGRKPAAPGRDGVSEQPRPAPRSDVALPTPPQPTPPRPSPGVSQPPRDGRRVEPPQPTPPRPEFPAQPPPQRRDDASKRTVATLGPFRFVIPKGWGIAEQHSDGMGITMGPDGKNNWPRYITFLQHPGLGRGPHTPEGINRAIQQNTRRQGATTAVTVGKKEHRGVWFSGSDGGGYVLFSPGGSVYMLGYGSSADKGMLQEILRTIEPKP